MRMKKYITTAAAVMMMTAGMAAANAATTADITYTTNSTKDVPVVYTVTNLKGVASSATTVATITLTPAAVALKSKDVITIKVNGAKFDRTALGATPVALSSGAATWVLDTANTTLTGTVTTASASLTTTTITLTGKYDLTGVAAGTKVTVNVSVSGKVLGLLQVTHKNAANTPDRVVLITTPSFQKFAITNPTKATATVASGFTKFDATTTNVTAAAVTDPATSIPTTTLTDSAAAGTATGTLLVKLTGVPANATKVDWAVAGISQSNATGLAAPATPTAAGNFWLDGNGNGYAKLTPGASKAAITATALVVTVNGTAAISPTTVQMTVNYLAGASDKFVAHTITGPVTVASIVRNGSSFSVNASGPLNTIKITDMSGALTANTGKISVTAFDASGSLSAGTAPVIPALTSNSTQTISMSTLTTAYPTAVRFDFAIGSANILASNVKKAATGTTITTYSNSKDTVAGSSVTPGSGAL